MLTPRDTNPLARYLVGILLILFFRGLMGLKNMYMQEDPWELKNK